MPRHLQSTHTEQQGGGRSVKHAFKHPFLPKGIEELCNLARQLQAPMQSHAARTEDKQTLPKKGTQGGCAPQRETLHAPNFALSAVNILPVLSLVPCWEQGYHKHL